jgi:hypothetical protein
MGVNLPPQDGLYAALKSLDRRLTALENQQNWGITDGAGVQRIKAGLQDDGTFGIWIYDGAGNLEVKLGDLTGGAFGLGVTNQAGVLQRVSGVVMVEVATAENYSSTSWGDLATPGPLVTATIGPSGQALLTLCANMNTGTPPGGGETALAGLSVDGAAVLADPVLKVSAGGGSGGVGTSVSLTYLLGGLSQGSHTFEMKYSVSTTGVAGSFQDRLLSVQPL